MFENEKIFAFRAENFQISIVLHQKVKPVCVIRYEQIFPYLLQVT